MSPMLHSRALPGFAFDPSMEGCWGKWLRVADPWDLSADALAKVGQPVALAPISNWCPMMLIATHHRV